MSKTTQSDPSFAEVWDTLSKINVNDHTQKRNGMTYLSWAWAWQTLMANYPFATYEFAETDRDDITGTVTVWCTVSIGALQRTMWLPVMTGYQNKAVQNPDARDVGDARMRCLVKCLAMFGLGHYIYAGEDVPPESAPKAESKPSKPVKIEEPEPNDVPQKNKIVTDDKSTTEIPDNESAEKLVTFMIGLVDDMHSDSLDALLSFWKENKQTIDLLDTKFKGQYDRLKNHFTVVKNKLKGEQA